MLETVSLIGDAQDLAKLRASLTAWAAALSDEQRREALSEALDALHYVAELEDNHVPLADAFCDPALEPVGAFILLERLCEQGSQALADHVRARVDPSRAPASARLEAARLAVTLFARTAATPAWSAFLSTLYRDGSQLERAVALVALSFAAPQGADVSSLVAGPLPTGPELEAAAAFALRKRATTLTGDALALASTAGEPGALRRVLSRTLGLSLDPDAVLPPFELLTPPGELEPAEVVFAGASLVLLRHATRGTFTLKFPAAGIEKGATLHLGDFLGDRPQRARWTVGETTREAIFNLQGELIRWAR